MKSILLVATGCLLLSCVAAPAVALDRVQLARGRAVGGDVVRTTPLEVTVKAGANEETVAVNEILFIGYEGEPAQLASVRSSVRSGNYENVLRQIERIDQRKISRAEIQQDMQFYHALATAKLALRGAGDVREAGRLMQDFVSKYPDSYHYLTASEALGELLVEVGAYDQAVDAFQKLESAPWPQAKIRAAVLAGRARVAKGTYPEALKSFEKALALAPEGDAATESQRLAAILGKATCLAATDKYDEATTLVEDVIAKADKEDADLHAQAYVTLGNCLRQKPDGAKEALLAYLHVDVLYFNNPRAHAEALFNLKELWTQLGKGERALDAARVLEERYAGSAWAKAQ